MYDAGDRARASWSNVVSTIVSMIRVVFLPVLLALAGGALSADTYKLTVKEAVQRALEQNPDVVLARLDEYKAAQGIRLARDPFLPRLDVGSGLAYTNGYPQSVEGSAPSIITAKASAFVYNRQQTYILAQAHENARGAALATASKRDEVAFRTASLYLDLDRAAKLGEMAGKQVESLTKVAATARSRVKKAMSSRSRKSGPRSSSNAPNSASNPSRPMRMKPSARLPWRSATPPRTTSSPPAESCRRARCRNPSRPRLRAHSIPTKTSAGSNRPWFPKGLKSKATKRRLPRVDLVAQYALFSRFNHLDEYFLRFQKNNEELGLAFSVPLLPGPGISAQVNQAEADATKIRVQYASARNRIMLDIHQAYQDLRKSQTARDVTQADLDWARESLSVLLAQMAEGRASLRQVEEARIVENEKWLAFYDAQYAAERARLTVLRETGGLVASLR